MTSPPALPTAEEVTNAFPGFVGFAPKLVAVNGVNIFCLTDVSAQAQSKPALLLLHGYPQTHVIWHRVAPLLKPHFNIVMSDLRGYGRSSKPSTTVTHEPYCKRVMAQDQVALMQALGHASFYLCGHDRGGRVSHRLALDHPQAVKKLCTLDIAPTLAMYEQTTMDFAKSYWWWFFLIQPAPFPEQLVSASPEVYLKKKIGYGSAGLKPFTEAAYQAYLEAIRDEATFHAMCEDYRAAATIDLEHDRADRDRGHFLSCPVHALWGEYGVVNRCFKPLDEWRKVTHSQYAVTGGTVPGGHYIPEELPERLANELLTFFKSA
jgi:haloacetate dehalogenase